MRPFRLCIAFPALAFLLVAQPTQYAKYPSAIATDTDLLLLNVGSTTLASFVDASATSLTFVGTNPFAAPLAVQIGSELVFCSGSNGNGLTGCTRGWKGTKAASHGATAAVMSWYNDTQQLAKEVEAIEANLGVALANVQPAASLAPMTQLPAAAAATIGRVYTWTKAPYADFCPDSGGGGYLGTATASCVTLDGSTWQAILLASTTTVGSESLNEGAFATHVKWTATGDWAFTGGAAVFTESTGSGQITQTSANMAIAPVANAIYKFTYDATSTSTGDLAAYITTGVPASPPVALTLGSGNVLYFTSAGSVTNFVIGASGTSGNLTLDNLSLKQVTSGSLPVGSLKLLNLIGLGKLPLCIGTDGTITAGTNTGGVLACP